MAAYAQLLLENRSRVVAGQLSEHLDGITAKYDAIAARVVGSEEKQVQLMTKRTDVREILGDKVMQELIIK